MGFLQRFFKNAPRDESTTPELKTSFEQLSDDELEAHLGVDRYGKFSLTEAVRPSYDLKVVPQQGYRHDAYRDEEANANVPVLMAAASSEILFDVFMELVEPLGAEVDVVLETSHHRDRSGHLDLYREHIDVPILQSILWDYEQLLLNDGCTGIAVLNPGKPQEVQFDEHKLLIVYGEPLQPFEKLLESYGVCCNEDIKFITEAEHIHSSSEKFYREFEQLKTQLGMDTSTTAYC